MIEDQTVHDVLVVGGGLAGIAATVRLTRAGRDALLLDTPLPFARARLGGLCDFSGAKFSLPPAGMGLLPVAGSWASLLKAVSEVADLLRIGTPDLPPDVKPEATGHALPGGLVVRRYASLVLLPGEVSALIEHLTEVVPRAVSIRASVRELIPVSGGWCARAETSAGTRRFHGRAILIAAGRSGADLLVGAGAVPAQGKGIDVGIRLEFPQRSSVAGLLQIGPDPKILSGRCRTFCLNSPGKIVRYPFRHLSLPGGIVAPPGWQGANVGLLVRCPDKESTLRRLFQAQSRLKTETLERSYLYQGGFQLPTSVIEALYGPELCEEIRHFGTSLGNADLLNFGDPFAVHLPLLDWHWAVFAVGASCRTTLPGVFVAGDVAGHARGLLQAGVSGWLAASEILERGPC